MPLPLYIMMRIILGIMVITSFFILIGFHNIFGIWGVAGGAVLVWFIAWRKFPWNKLRKDEEDGVHRGSKD